jgi:hypothetical protein
MLLRLGISQFAAGKHFCVLSFLVDWFILFWVVAVCGRTFELENA